MSVDAGEQVVAVDAMGGDHAPMAVVAGALRAAGEHGIRLPRSNDHWQSIC